MGEETTKLNPYQRIIKDGELIQKGDMDTPVKFAQLMTGIDLTGKRVLDVGCNLGMMCRLSLDAGAVSAKGIDINPEYIEQARGLFPEIQFECETAEGIAGEFDIIIASGMLHYLRDLDVAFRSFARCSKMVVLDIWLNDSPDAVFTLSHRNIFIPSKSAFLHIAGKYFRKIEEKGPALSPDISKRYVFHLLEPCVDKPKAVLVYGEGNTGKTTLATKLFGHVYLGTDHIARSWRYDNREYFMSVAWFSNLARGKYQQEYLDYYFNWFSKWLPTVKNKDIVLEGYDLMFDDLRAGIIAMLDGWEVSEIRMIKGYDTRSL